MKRATYEDVLNAPENKVAEILEGELVVSPRPSLRHAFALSRLQRAIGNPYDSGVGGPGGWWILVEPELHLGSHVVVPDLAGWRRDRLPVIPDEAYSSLAPAWVCEVMSPSTERFDRSRKLRIYAEAGVAHVWLVKPTDRTLEILYLRDGAWTIVGFWEDSAVIRVEPFAQIDLELGLLWQDEIPPSPATP